MKKLILIAALLAAFAGVAQAKSKAPVSATVEGAEAQEINSGWLYVFSDFPQAGGSVTHVSCTGKNPKEASCEMYYGNATATITGTMIGATPLYKLFKKCKASVVQIMSCGPGKAGKFSCLAVCS